MDVRHNEPEDRPDVEAFLGDHGIPLRDELELEMDLG